MSHRLTTTPRRALPLARRISVVLLAAAGFVTFGAARADAFPTGCSAGQYFSNGGYAICTGGTGQYRVRMRCDASWWPDYNRYGPWRNAGSGQRSIAVCDGIDHPFDITLEAFGPN
jgi:hypothetical protein